VFLFAFLKAMLNLPASSMTSPSASACLPVPLISLPLSLVPLVLLRSSM
jgi:hypothetical protein